MAGGHGERAHRFEVASRVDHVDPQDRETPLIGIAPAGAGGGEGIDEIAAELAVEYGVSDVTLRKRQSRAVSKLATAVSDRLAHPTP